MGFGATVLSAPRRWLGGLGGKSAEPSGAADDPAVAAVEAAEDLVAIAVKDDSVGAEVELVGGGSRRGRLVADDVVLFAVEKLTSLTLDSYNMEALSRAVYLACFYAVMKYLSYVKPNVPGKLCTKWSVARKEVGVWVFKRHEQVLNLAIPNRPGSSKADKGTSNEPDAKRRKVVIDAGTLNRANSLLTYQALAPDDVEEFPKFLVRNSDSPSSCTRVYVLSPRTTIQSSY